MQWLVQRFRSERLRVRSRRSATSTPSANGRRQSLSVWPPRLNKTPLPFIFHSLPCVSDIYSLCWNSLLNWFIFLRMVNRRSAAVSASDSRAARWIGATGSRPWTGWNCFTPACVCFEVPLHAFGQNHQVDPSDDRPEAYANDLQNNTVRGLYYYPGKKKSLQPRNSWGWSTVWSCDIVRYRASVRHQRDSR